MCSHPPEKSRAVTHGCLRECWWQERCQTVPLVWKDGVGLTHWNLLQRNHCFCFQGSSSRYHGTSMVTEPSFGVIIFKTITKPSWLQTYFILWYKGTWSSCQRRGDLYSLLLQNSHTVQSLSGITYSPHKMRSSRSGFNSLLKAPQVFTEDVWHHTTLDQLCIPCILREGMAFILARNSTNSGHG